MTKNLCIHCSDVGCCPFQQGIYCTTTPCLRDKTNTTTKGDGDGRTVSKIKNGSGWDFAFELMKMFTKPQKPRY